MSRSWNKSLLLSTVSAVAHSLMAIERRGMCRRGRRRWTGGFVLGLDRLETASFLRSNGTFQYLTGLPSFPIRRPYVAS